jgi:hypothetical protein
VHHPFSNFRRALRKKHWEAFMRPDQETLVSEISKVEQEAKIAETPADLPFDS